MLILNGKKQRKPGVYSLAGLFVLLLTINGCSGDDTADSRQVTGNNTTGGSTVLVHVNGQEITRADLDVHLLRALKTADLSTLDNDARYRALEGLVMSKIISQFAEKELDASDKDNIERQVRLYREELMVKQFLKKHIKPETITQDMIENFYRNNPEKFGGGEVIHYELLTANESPKGKQRSKYIKLLTAAKSNSDWNTVIEKGKKQGLQLRMKTGTNAEKLLHDRLRALIAQVGEGQTSEPAFVDGKPYLIRVTARKQRQVRPLAEVSADIRKHLMPVKVKASIRELSSQLMEKSNIEYLDKVTMRN